MPRKLVEKSTRCKIEKLPYGCEINLHVIGAPPFLETVKRLEKLIFKTF